MAGDTTQTQFSPQTVQPLPGTLLREFKRCGKTRCHCATGELHTFYRRTWREQGRTRHAYVRQVDVPAVAAACARYRELHMSRRAFRRMLSEFARGADALVDALEAMQRGDAAAVMAIIERSEARQ